MKKKLNEIIYASIVMSVFFLVMGILLVVNPEISLDVISYMIATFLIINAAVFQKKAVWMRTPTLAP